jgi:uncharacterized protein with von Willebrand factor type A (vWA) domain
VFIAFLYELRRLKVPVGPMEARMLARALELGLHGSSLEGFYHVARATLVHREAHLDAFDRAFDACFRGASRAGQALSEELLKWLEDAKQREGHLTDEERALLSRLDPEEIRRLLQQRMEEQRERHDLGSRWIGTGGTSPFGNMGAFGQQGFRVGGSSMGRGAVQSVDPRRYEPYRDDVILDTRQIGMALRKLRAFAREGAHDELDVEGTIDATAKNAGELEVVVRAPRRPNTRVILLMDVGGSMSPYAHLVSRLFSAASKATHFKELRTYYFHNCVYGRVYGTSHLQEEHSVHRLLQECGPHYKLVLVGDALMAPYELFSPWGNLMGADDTAAPAGMDWLVRLSTHFTRKAWLNPEPERSWRGNTIEAIGRVIPMFPLTIEGLGRAVGELVRA